jgi:VCBS repeat-containing protein
MGTDSFGYTVIRTDVGLGILGGEETCAKNSVTIHVVDPTKLAVLGPDRYTTLQNTPLPSTSTRNILDNDYVSSSADLLGPRSLAVATSTSNGALTLNQAGTFVYTSTAGFLGSDTFSHQVRAGGVPLATTTVTIDVLADKRPLAVDDEFVVTTNAASLVVAASSGVLANDPKSTDLGMTAVKVTDPSNGSLTFNTDGSFTYTRNAGFTGTDSFNYRAVNPYATDTGDTSVSDPDVATVTIKVVTPITAGADEYVALAGVELSTTAATGVLRNDRDPANAAMTAVLVSSVSNGTLALNTNGSFTYTASSTFSGVDTFTYKARNASLVESTSTTVTLRVSMNPKPRAGDDFYDYNSYLVSGSVRSVSSTIGVLNNDRDPLRGPLTAVLATDPVNGSVTLNSDGSFSYTPNAGFIGTDTFTYRAQRFGDGNLLSDPATVSIVVYSVTPARRSLPKYGLTVTKSGAGTGTVTSTDNIINCGETCTGSFFPVLVELRATSDAGSVFSGWGGVCAFAATSSQCFLPLGTTSTATATFGLPAAPPVPSATAWSLGALAAGLGVAALVVLMRRRAKQPR